MIISIKTACIDIYMSGYQCIDPFTNHSLITKEDQMSMQQFVLCQDWFLCRDKRMLKYHFYMSQTLEVNDLLSRHATYLCIVHM